MQIRVTPKFNTKEIIDKTISKHWLDYQYQGVLMGAKLSRSVRQYINAHRKRTGGTGNLSRAISWEKKIGKGYFFWGIGDLNILQTRAPYWYVINYGKYIDSKIPFVPGHSMADAINPHFIHGLFTDGAYADPNQRGSGHARFAKQSETNLGMIPGVIRPMNYIQYLKSKFSREYSKILTKITK